MKTKLLLLSLVLVLCSLTLLSCSFSFGDDTEQKPIEVIEYSKEDLEELLNQILSDRTETNFSVNDIVINSSDPASLLAASKGLLSTVSIHSTFTVKSYVGFGPIRDWVTEEVKSAGSGVIFKMSEEDKVSGNAYIITNYHVVYNSSSMEENHIASKIQLFLYGMEKEKYAINAEYIGGSMYYDIAVLKVRASDIVRKSNAIEATFANSDDVTILETAIAIGNPEADGISATVGHVNVDSEIVPMILADDITVADMRLMRIDTAVNGGNSGGGLFNERGEIIGIVNAKIVSSTIDNIGYAIPSNVARMVAENIIYYENTDSECVKKALIGVTLSEDTNSHTVYDPETGKVHIIEEVVIAEVKKGSLSDGVIQIGDIITSIKIGNATPTTVTRNFHVVERMLTARVGDVVVLEILRDGVAMTINLTITSTCLNDIF